MGIPDYLSLMRPTLEALSDGLERTPADLRRAMADHFALTDDELAQLLPSGTGRLFHNRVAWAITYLHHAGATERVRRAIYRISDRGRDLLARYPDSAEFYRAVEQTPEIVAFRAGSGESGRRREARAAADETGIPPIERMAQAQAELDDALASDLLTRIRESDSTFFERLVLKLLVAMGYGGSEEEAAEHLGGSGDRGVDGVINEDRLGLDRIYVQAKRWAENPVRRPEVQGFVGALEGQGASKGVFITASRFTQEARSYAEGIRQRVILIDGQQLAELLIRHDVGVTTRRVVAVKEVDEDFFADDLLA
jgi:restriction system protein